MSTQQRIKEWTDDTAYAFNWVGDTVRSIAPNAPFLPFHLTTAEKPATP